MGPPVLICIINSKQNLKRHIIISYLKLFDFVSKILQLPNQDKLIPHPVLSARSKTFFYFCSQSNVKSARIDIKARGHLFKLPNEASF